MENKTELLVYKFGGASINNAQGFKCVVSILRDLNPAHLLIVVSATGKTTNALENLCVAFYERDHEKAKKILQQIKDNHNDIMHGLFNGSDDVYDQVENLFVEIEWVLEDEPHDSFDFIYDQIVSIGELISSRILSAALKQAGLDNSWADSRDYLITDNNYREASLFWPASTERICGSMPAILENKWIVTQGFIGSSTENFTTTLGREGSDYSAAIFASVLKASSLTVWKDVPGIMNADPRIFQAAQLIPKLSYSEAVEMAYYGATVIHPKTLSPLQNLNIPLYVKSFLKPNEPGTCVSSHAGEAVLPSFIYKKNQMLLSLHTVDASFIMEEHLSQIFTIFHSFKVKINMMENSALSFSVAIDQNSLTDRITGMMQALQEFYQIRYNDDLTLITVRNYRCDPDAVKEIFKDAEILVESRTRSTLQRLIR